MSGVKRLVQLESRGLEQPTNEQLRDKGINEAEIDEKDSEDGDEGEEE